MALLFTSDLLFLARSQSWHAPSVRLQSDQSINLTKGNVNNANHLGIRYGTVPFKPNYFW